MKLKLLLAAALLAAAASAPLVRAEEQESAGKPDAHETFEHGMESADEAYDALKTSAFDAASRDADLRHAQAMQEGLLASKSVAGEMPMMGPAKTKYADDAAAYHRDLRAGLVKAVKDALDLEEAINRGDTPAAKAAFEQVKADMKQGHKSFRPGRDNVGEPGKAD